MGRKTHVRPPPIKVEESHTEDDISSCTTSIAANLTDFLSVSILNIIYYLCINIYIYIILIDYSLNYHRILSWKIFLLITSFLLYHIPNHSQSVTYSTMHSILTKIILHFWMPVLTVPLA